MSCSRALVLMAMVNRTCATRSWWGSKEDLREGQVCCFSGAPRALSTPSPVHWGGVMLSLWEEAEVHRLVFTAEQL